MEMVYRERWEAEIAAMRRVLAGLAMKEECKWGKPTYTVDGKNIVILQGFKEYFGLGFFQGALLKDPKKVLVQLGQVHAGRVMKFTSAKDITAKAATIKAYVREAIAVERAGLRSNAEEDVRFPVSRGVEAAAPKGPSFQARLRGADAGAAEKLPVPLRRGQAVGDAGGANRKGDARDILRFWWTLPRRTMAAVVMAFSTALVAEPALRRVEPVAPRVRVAICDHHLGPLPGRPRPRLAGPSTERAFRRRGAVSRAPRTNGVTELAEMPTSTSPGPQPPALAPPVVFPVFGALAASGTRRPFPRP